MEYSTLIEEKNEQLYQHRKDIWQNPNPFMIKKNRELDIEGNFFHTT